MPRLSVKYAVFVFVLVLWSVMPSMASTLTVTSTADNGAGTLRTAIASTASGDTIQFSLTYPATITLTSGLLEINKNLTISGPGAANLAISGNNASQVFQIDSGATVSISGLTIENGAKPDPFQPQPGGGIYNSGTLTLTSSTLSGNDSNYIGGAIYNDSGGTMTVTNSTISGNSAQYAAGGIENGGTMTVANSTISDNFVYNDGTGGGVLNDGTLTVTNSTISHNITNYEGGGISNGGTMTLTKSTISGNGALILGGGIYNGSGTLKVSTLTVTNSTLAGNSADPSGLGGGGIYNDSKGMLTVTNSTLVGNSAGSTGLGGGGIQNLFDGTVTVKNTLLANNTGSVGTGNCNGSLTSDGHNLSDDASCSIYFTAMGDLNSISAGLDPNGLQNNGGLTQTIALLATSPAVDAIPVSPTNYCTAVDGVTPIATDQRGVTRPQGAGCDIGAFELSIPFSALSAKLAAIVDGPLPGFALDANFTLGITSAGINPLTEPVSLTVGSYSATIPAGSFKQLTGDGYYYLGTINKVRLMVTIVPLGGNRFQLMAAALPVRLAKSNPVAVFITIGNNSGNAQVTARFR